MVPGLAAVFRSHAKVRLSPSEADAELEGLLTRAWEASRERWANVALPAEPFVKHLAERLPTEAARGPIGPILSKLPLADLYLACACLQGTPFALETIEQHYFSRMPALLRNLRRSEAVIEDACQLVRMNLLVTTPERTPKLAKYTGRGGLLNWVQMAAVRAADKLSDRERFGQHEGSDDVIDIIPDPGPLPDELLPREIRKKAFRQATREAFSSLSPRQRYLLRLYYVDGLTTYQMAPLFRVNQGTISRWLADARLLVYKETRRLLQDQLGLSLPEFESFIDSQLDLSISRLMVEEDAGAD